MRIKIYFPCEMSHETWITSLNMITYYLNTNHTQYSLTECISNVVFDPFQGMEEFLALLECQIP